MATILSGKPYRGFVVPESGRFMPMIGQELNLFAKFTLNPQIIYYFNALCFLLSSYLIINFFKKLNLQYFYLIFFFMHPGLVNAFYRVFVSEKLCAMFIIIFLVFYKKYENQNRLYYLMISFLASFLALFYKEPVFLLISSFLFFEACRKYFNDIKNFKAYLVDILGILGCSVFILYYYFNIHLKITERYKEISTNYLFNHFKIITGFFLYDPFTIIIGPVLIFLTFKDVFLTRQRRWDWSDSLLTSALIYSSTFIYLGIWEFYYFLPSNIFLVIAIASKFKSLINLKFVKMFFVFALVIWFTNALPESLNQFFWQKEIPKNFQATLKYFQTHPTSTPINVLLIGVDENRSGGEFVPSIKRYSDFYGIKNVNFYSDPLSSTNIKMDYYLITPYSLSSEFDISQFRTHSEKAIFATKFPIVLPDLSLKGLIRRMFRPIANKLLNLKLEDRYFWNDYNFYLFKNDL